MADVKGPDMPELFERLVETYQTPLRRLCCVMLKDVHLADDAVQETFLKAYRALNDFRRESSGKTWLTRIAVNTCRDMMKSRWFRWTAPWISRICPRKAPKAIRRTRS